jgi:hypothetical protein
MVRPVCGGNQGASAGFANSTYLVSDKEKVFSSGVAQAHRRVFVSNLFKRWNGGLQHLSGLAFICRIAIGDRPATRPSKNPYGKLHPLQFTARARFRV